MSDPTLGFYDSDPGAYFDATFGIDMSDARRRFSSRVRPGGRILDLGCGSCRDTVAFRAEGFDAVPADASEGMRRIVRERLGIEVEPVGFGDVGRLGRFDGVWACASLLHVPRADLPGVLDGIRRVLSGGGALFCCFKEGRFEGMRGGRMYTDMTADALTALLEGRGFEPADVWTSRGASDSWVSAVSVSGGHI